LQIVLALASQSLRRNCQKLARNSIIIRADTLASPLESRREFGAGADDRVSSTGGV
jgi:hypothetical protein